MAAVEAQKIRSGIFVKKGLAQASPFRLHKVFQKVKSNKSARAAGAGSAPGNPSQGPAGSHVVGSVEGGLADEQVAQSAL